MSSHRHRITGWFDLKLGTVSPIALPLLLGFVPIYAQLPEEEPLAPRIESADDTIFLAPFVNLSFLRAVQEDLAEIQILRERSTGVYFDRKTLLLWTARDNGRGIDWRRAQDYCFELELAGFDDWRMPILGELEDIMNPMSGSGYSTPKEISLSACCVWSSTRRGDVAAWNFNYRFSKRFSASLTHTYDLRALCVRSWSEADGWIPGEEETPTEP